MRVAKRLVEGILVVPLALACAAPAPEGEPGEVPEWTLRRPVLIGSSDDPIYGFSAVGGVLADEQSVYVILPQEGRMGFQPLVPLFDLRAASIRVPSGSGRERGAFTNMPLVALDTAGTVRDTLATLSLAVSVEITAGAVADGVLRRRHPLDRGDTWQFARDGSGAVIVQGRSWTGTGPAEYGVTRVNSEGDTLFHRRIAYEPRPLPNGYYDRDIEESLDLPIVTDRREFADALREFLERVRYFPPVTNVQVGSDGTVWIAGPDEGGERTWLVLDSSGSSIGRFRLPTSSRVSDADRTAVWVVEKDAFDIPYVARYEITSDRRDLGG